MEKKKLKRFIADSTVLYLWWRGDFGVDDDLAYVALLRVRELVEDSLRVLEGKPSVELGEEK